MSNSFWKAKPQPWIARDRVEELTDKYLAAVGSPKASEDLRLVAKSVVRAYGENGVDSAIQDFNIIKSGSGEKLSFELK